MFDRDLNTPPQYFSILAILCSKAYHFFLVLFCLKRCNHVFLITKSTKIRSIISLLTLMVFFCVALEVTCLKRNPCRCAFRTLPNVFRTLAKTLLPPPFHATFKVLMFYSNTTFSLWYQQSMFYRLQFCKSLFKSSVNGPSENHESFPCHLEKAQSLYLRLHINSLFQVTSVENVFL